MRTTFDQVCRQKFLYYVQPKSTLMAGHSRAWFR